mmetsp:Transcript_70880/g.207687  ORF Transcript_70880/g.207687 Transcript_70880/m.207687 type:complete len:679 (-) Transcript_70880:165-2201(-)
MAHEFGLPAGRAREQLLDPDQPHLPAEQMAGEHLRNDPDWRGDCWLAAYLCMHRVLISKAREIQAERQVRREAAQAVRQEETPSVAASLRMLRNEVFSLTPKCLLASGVFASVVLTLFSFLAPLVSGRLVDTAIALLRRNAPLEEIWPALAPHVALYAALLFGSYTGEVLVGILFAVSGHITVTRLRIKLFRNLVRQEIAFYDLHVSGELSSRLINDSGSLSNLVQFTTQTLFGALVKFFGSLASMYLTHPGLAVIATVITPVNMFLVKKTGGIVGCYGVVQNDAMAKANAVSVEVLGNIRTVQSNVGEDMEADRFMCKINYFLRVVKATVYLETALRFVSYGLSKTRDVVILAVGMHQVATGSLTVGSYTAFASYISLYEAGFGNITNIWLNFKNTITSSGKFVQLLLRDPRISPVAGARPADCQGRVTFENITFAYAAKPDKHVVRGVHLEARPGTITALVGESGAGKTTVGRLLQRHYDPVGGRLLLDGVDYTALNLRWLRSQIGVVEQEPVLFDRSLSENIAYGAASHKSLEDICAAARVANADGFISRLEGGYGSHPGERACRISGGQKQRVAIARAVVRDPKVLLLDEATSALDGTNEHEVQEALDGLMSGKTTVIIAHRLSTVVRATSILVLHEGEIIEKGTHQELVALNGKYASFMEHQLVSHTVAPLLS